MGFVESVFVGPFSNQNLQPFSFLIGFCWFWCKFTCDWRRFKFWSAYVRNIVSLSRQRISNNRPLFSTVRKYGILRSHYYIYLYWIKDPVEPGKPLWEKQTGLFVARFYGGLRGRKQ
jgi:hypothetical protein